MGQVNRVLFTIGNMGGGGAERVLSILANAFTDKGIQVCICCIGRKENHERYTLHPDIVIKSFHIKKDGAIRGKLAQLRALRREARSFKPDVIVGFMSYVAVQTIAACLLLHTPVVYVIRAYPSEEIHSAALRLACRCLYPFARGGVYQTQQQKDYFPPSKRRKEAIILNPVSRSTLWDTPQPLKKKKIVAIGRLSKEKNYPLLLRAFAAVHEDFPDFRLEIYGKGAELETLLELNRQLGLEEYVSMPGFVSNPDERVVDAALYVMTSEYEGLPNALIEAMCLGVPCIATDFDGGGASVLIRDGIDGKIVPKGDVDALADAMRWMLSHPREAEQMGLRARELRARAETSAVAKQWLSFLEEVVL